MFQGFVGIFLDFEFHHPTLRQLFVETLLICGLHALHFSTFMLEEGKTKENKLYWNP